MNAKTRRLLEIFEEISRIPRCSKNEEAIARWFDAWARAKNFASRRDRVGNRLITVPATPGAEAAPAVVIQGHLDMVCEKTPASTHDFTRDPIRIIHDGDWIHADETTLGADNGARSAANMPPRAPSLFRSRKRRGPLTGGRPSPRRTRAQRSTCSWPCRMGWRRCPRISATWC